MKAQYIVAWLRHHNLAFVTGVNKLESSIFPSLHHRKEGWPSESQNIAKLPLIARPGWFSDRKPKGKPPRLRLLRWLRNILLTTQPPLAPLQLPRQPQGTARQLAMIEAGGPVHECKPLGKFHGKSPLVFTAPSRLPVAS